MNDDKQPILEKNSARRLLAFLPLVIFVALAAIFLYQLKEGENPNKVPSVLIGTKAPSLDLKALEGLKREDGAPVPALNNQIIKNKLALINVFASWCAPCRQEHPLLLSLARDQRITLVGVNYKDKQENALRFLNELGNPYVAVGVDPDGQTSIDWGVYGVPETYLVGQDGTILFKQIGPFTPTIIEQKLMPLIALHTK